MQLCAACCAGRVSCTLPSLCSVEAYDHEWGSMPIMRLVSSNTNQLMPAAGATLARFGRMPCKALQPFSAAAFRAVISKP